MDHSHGLRDFIAGTLSGAAGVICGQPLDTIRVCIEIELPKMISLCFSPDLPNHTSNTLLYV